MIRCECRLSSEYMTLVTESYTWCTKCTKEFYSGIVFGRKRFDECRIITEKNSSVVSEKTSKLWCRTT